MSRLVRHAERAVDRLYGWRKSTEVSVSMLFPGRPIPNAFSLISFVECRDALPVSNSSPFKQSRTPPLEPRFPGKQVSLTLATISRIFFKEVFPVRCKALPFLRSPPSGSPIFKLAQIAAIETKVRLPATLGISFWSLIPFLFSLFFLHLVTPGEYGHCPLDSWP